MNNYFLEGSDLAGRSIEIEKIISKEGFSLATTSIYDLENKDLSDVLEDLDTYGLFSEKKVIIVRNIDLFKIDDNKDKYDHFIRYLNNYDKDKLLIIEADKLNSNTKLSKDLKKLCSYKEIEINTKSLIKEYLKGYSVNQNTINLIDEYCLGDIVKIQTECDKLKLYKLDEKIIDEKDVLDLVEKKLGDSKDLVFSFTRSLAEKDKKCALKKYLELLDYNIQPLSIIGLLANQMRIIYQVKILSDKGLSNIDMAKMLNEKEFRIKKTRELIGYYTENDCLDMINKLSDIDLKIKTTDTDSNREIELFIMNL